MEAVESTGIGNQAWPLGLERLPDGLVAELGMPVRLGIGQAPVEQPGVELVIALDPQPRAEEAFAHQPDLVLDLSLLPTRCRRASDRVDQIVPAHLQEPP